MKSVSVIIRGLRRWFSDDLSIEMQSECADFLSQKWAMSDHTNYVNTTNSQMIEQTSSMKGPTAERAMKIVSWPIRMFCDHLCLLISSVLYLPTERLLDRAVTKSSGRRKVVIDNHGFTESIGKCRCQIISGFDPIFTSNREHFRLLTERLPCIPQRRIKL